MYRCCEKIPLLWQVHVFTGIQAHEVLGPLASSPCGDQPFWMAPSCADRSVSDQQTSPKGEETREFRITSGFTHLKLFGIIEVMTIESFEIHVYLHVSTRRKSV